MIVALHDAEIFATNISCFLSSDRLISLIFKKMSAKGLRCTGNTKVRVIFLFLLDNFFFNIYLAAFVLSWGSQHLHCVTWEWDLSWWHVDCLVVACRFSSCGMRPWLLCSMWDLSSTISDWPHIPCNVRLILNYWTTRKVLIYLFKISKKDQING